MQLAELGEKWKALDARCVAQQSELEFMRVEMKELKSRDRFWKKERKQMLHEVDKNTTSAILRRVSYHLTPSHHHTI